MEEKRSSSAHVHTVVVNDAYEMWSKLFWDVEVFQDLQRRNPDEKEPLGFAAINACISISAFVDWVAKAALSGDKRSFLDEYPDFLMFMAIANTSKHCRHVDKAVASIEAKMVWFDGDENCAPTWALYYVNSGESLTAYERFDRIKIVAWRVLEKFGLTDNRPSGPEWHQRKLRRTFPPISQDDVKALIQSHQLREVQSDV